MQYFGYHDMTPNTYQSHFTSLANRGFRVISLSIHGDANDLRYTAVWAKYNAGPWIGKHGVKIQDFQAVFNNYTNQGYVPTIVTAVGKLDDAVFGIIFEKNNFGNWEARHGMKEVEFESENKMALDNDLILKSFTIYGTSSEKRFAAIWHQNPNKFKSHLHKYELLNEYQNWFDAETKLNLYRPSIVTISPDTQYGVHFTDNAVGRWIAKHHLDKNQYQHVFDECKAIGLMPICVDAIGKNENARYTAIFAESPYPEEKKWEISGSGVTHLVAIDSIAENFMRRNAVRAIQISVSKNGVNYYNKAYNLSESIYRKANPRTRFLLASCSKMFVCAAIQRLFDTNSLKPNDYVYKILGGFNSPKDSRSNDITIQQLIEMNSGYRREDDCTYNMRNIGLDLSPKRVITKQDLADYMYKKVALNYDPGKLPQNVDGYCNYNYVLLTMVIEKITGQDYFTYLKNNILIPENITDVKTWVTVKTPRDPDEILHEDQWLHPSAVNINSDDLVPDIYGGDGMVKEVAIGSCSLAASAFAMTQFIHQHAVWGIGGRRTSNRIGGTPGAYSFAESRDDGIDWAYTINTREFMQGKTAPNNLKNEITTVLNAKSDLLKPFTFRTPDPVL